MLSKTDAGLYAETIDSLEYEFEKWGAEESLDTLLDIAKITGKPLGLAVGAFFKEGVEGEKKEINPDAIGDIMEALVERLDKKTCMYLIKKLAADKVFCAGVKIKSFDLHYKDRLDHMFRVVKTALEVQYGSFFGALLGSAGISMPTKAIMNRVG